MGAGWSWLRDPPERPERPDAESELEPRLEPGGTEPLELLLPPEALAPPELYPRGPLLAGLLAAPVSLSTAIRGLLVRALFEG